MQLIYDETKTRPRPTASTTCLVVRRTMCRAVVYKRNTVLSRIHNPKRIAPGVGSFSFFWAVLSSPCGIATEKDSAYHYINKHKIRNYYKMSDTLCRMLTSFGACLIKIFLIVVFLAMIPSMMYARAGVQATRQYRTTLRLYAPLKIQIMGTSLEFRSTADSVPCRCQKTVCTMG